MQKVVNTAIGFGGGGAAPAVGRHLSAPASTAVTFGGGGAVSSVARHIRTNGRCERSDQLASSPVVVRQDPQRGGLVRVSRK